MRLYLRFIRTYMLPYTGWYVVGTCALFGTNWLAVTIPLYVADAIDALERQTLDVVYQAAISVALMGLAIMVIRSTSRVLFFTPGRYAEARIKRDFFVRVMEQQPSFLSQFPPGDLVSRSSSDVNHLRLLAGFGALQIINVSVVLGLTLTQMIRLSPWLTLWTVIPLGVGLVITRFFIRWLFILVKRIQKQTADLSDYILGSYRGVSGIQGFVAETAFVDRFEARNLALQKTLLQRTGLRTVISPILAFSTGVCVFLILYVGGPMSIRGELSTGEIVAFIALVSLLAGPLRGLSFLLAIVKQAQASLERLEAVIAPNPDRPDQPNPSPVADAPPALSIRNLTFCYPNESEPVLNDISVEVPAGSTLGVFGATGAGKSTLLSCIARLYNPESDQVLVDGEDVRSLDLEDWRAKMVFVPQRPFLFSETIWDNIGLGAFPESDAARVLNLTALNPDIEALPEGLNTEVGESGVMLSGGQRQRIALARGLVRRPRLLMLDDVLSAVDHHTEHQLIETLQDMGETPTTIIVAHRISALRHADQIIVLDKGRRVDAGTHAELVSRDGLYRDTWQKQQEVNRVQAS